MTNDTIAPIATDATPAATPEARRRLMALPLAWPLASITPSTGRASSRASARSGDAPVRLAVIEGLSGAFANAGEAVMRNLAFAVDQVNARGGVRVAGRRRPLELVRMDSKGQTEEALVLLRKAADESIPFVLQGNSSAVAGALLAAINRHNEREPSRRLLFLNYSAVEPALTEERCSFWHFRFDANARMRMSALIDALADDRNLRRVYLINQDYSFGHQFSNLARETLARVRPDIEVVADEFHPMGRIRDFAPYAGRIGASRAQAVISGNWGNDLTLMVRAVREQGLDLSFYTFYGNSLGAPAAIGDAGVGRVFAVSEWHPDAGVAAAEPILQAFRERLAHPRDNYFNMRHLVMMNLLADSISAADSTDAVAVARALEGRRHRHPPYEAQMRAEDHQLLTPLYVTAMARLGQPVRHDLEGSGYGFRTVRMISAERSAPPMRCRMQRP